MPYQVLGRGHKVREGIFLVHHAPVVVPGLPHFAATANVGHRRHHAAIDHAEKIGVEADVNGISVRAIAGQIERPFSIQLCTLQVHHGDRNLHSVGSRRINLLHLISRAVVAAGHFFLLQQRGLAADHVVLEDRPRRNERLVAIAEFTRIVFTIGVAITRVGGLGKLDPPRFTAAQIGYPDLRQSIFPLAQYVVVLEEVRVVQHDVCAMGNDLLPILAPRISHRRLH